MNLIKDHAFTLTLFGKAILFEPVSQRLKVYDLPDRNLLDLFIKKLKKLAFEKGCDKLIFYVRRHEQPLINPYATRYEGKIAGFFNGEDAHIYALFLHSGQYNTRLTQEEKNVFRLVKHKQGKGPSHCFKLPSGFFMRWAVPEDINQMVTLYKTVFKSYPTPMNDPAFIRKMMDDGVYFLVVEHDRRIVSACSAELLPEFKAAELSDCATYRKHRKKQLLSYQVAHLLPRVKDLGVRTIFSYSRSVSSGMNLVNAKHGFHFGGRMLRNSNICGRLENMNIWYKNL
ncbi:putative beta-lysine N-acetyltransferase [Salipaludibacillus aurantiacus]|uniref:Putative beta-lysine N-acetyltransferase n=1 Tax=Salipaludibacillus aurantiacus TaxID=1601833 RepID=A0A1H9VHQ0_9BACI|nr:putative beta-lysine N-acetyltransferase [Salipaludibacillus aurantiacus]SES21316.1 putative beta-lysine N-acetyltransferase [Salipaludibacillus aurantiacus]